MAAAAMTPIQPTTILPAPEVAVVEEVLEAEAPVPVAVPEAEELPEAEAVEEASEAVAVEEPVAVPFLLAPAEEVAVVRVVEEPEEVTEARVVAVVAEAVPEEEALVAEEALVEDAEAEEEEEDEPSVMLNWFCLRLSVTPSHDIARPRFLLFVLFLFFPSTEKKKSNGGEYLKTYRLGVDLLGLVTVGEVDGERVAGGQLAAVDGGRAGVLGNVGHEQGADRRVLDLVGQVDAESILIRGDGVPGDSLGLTGSPDGALGRRGDLKGGGSRGEGQDNHRRHHFCD